MTPSASIKESQISSSSLSGFVSLPVTVRTRCTKRRSRARTAVLKNMASNPAWVTFALETSVSCSSTIARA